MPHILLSRLLCDFTLPLPPLLMCPLPPEISLLRSTIRPNKVPTIRMDMPPEGGQQPATSPDIAPMQVPTIRMDLPAEVRHQPRLTLNDERD